MKVQTMLKNNIFSGAIQRNSVVQATRTVLAVFLLSVCCHVAAAATYYVATSAAGGNDGSNGSASTPWLTLGHAAWVVQPGDVVIVKNGTYNEIVWLEKGGTAALPIQFRAETKGGAKFVGTGYSTLNVRANYLSFDGFDVTAKDGHGFDVEGVHHITIKNSIAHDCGGSGIQTNWSEYITVEGNTTFQNAKTNGNHCSGISLYENRPISDANTGFHNIVRNNVCYDNGETAAITGNHTDGNGIIIDDFHNEQGAGQQYPYANQNYTYKTLVENNICYHNGGKGIQVYITDNVTVRNNTVYWNNWDNLNNATWRGELSIQETAGSTFTNNICVTNPAYNANNVGINAGSTGFNDSTTTVFNNLSFNGTNGNISVGLRDATQIMISSSNNKLGFNPLFVTASITNPNFRLQSSSPAIAAGTLGGSATAAPNDITGAIRPSGTAVDLGVYLFVGTPTPPPPPTTITQFDFEANAQGWVSGGGITGTVVRSTTRANTGTASLAINLQGTGAGTAQTSVASPGVPAGATVTLKYWIPTNSNFDWVQVYVQANNWSWIGSTVNNPTKGAWNTITLSVPAGTSVPVQTLGIQFHRTGSFTGTAFIDTIQW